VEKAAKDLELTQDKVRSEQGLGSVFKNRPRTSTLDRYLVKKSPAKYLPNSDQQRRVDLDLMGYLATTNLPFSHVETRGFKKYVLVKTMLFLVKRNFIEFSSSMS
jgi:hypothetical protein